MNRHIHHVPGRLRVCVPAIRKNGPNAALVQKLLLDVTGVSSAEPNTLTGSMVVRYNPSSTSAALILSALTEGGYLRLVPAAPAPEQNAAARIRNKVASAVFWYCVEKAVERSVPLLFAALL